MQDPASSSDWTLPEWPAFGLQSDVRLALRRACEASRPVVLGTLYAHEGAAPLGEGAQILFDDGMAAAGFLSGGCVEGDIAHHATGVLEGGEARRLVYGRGGPPDIQLLCGSRIEVLLERIAPDDEALARLLELEAARRPALWLSDGQERACLAEGEVGREPPAPLRPALAKACERPAISGPAAAGSAPTTTCTPPTGAAKAASSAPSSRTPPRQGAISLPPPKRAPEPAASTRAWTPLTPRRRRWARAGPRRAPSAPGSPRPPPRPRSPTARGRRCRGRSGP